MPSESKATRTGGRAATTGVIPGDIAISVGNPQTELPKGWEWRLLTDVSRLESGHTPSRRHPEYWGGNVPWIGIRDATGNHGCTIYATEQYTNALGIENSSARVLPANTVCLSRTASVGYVVVMGVPMATSQDFVNWVCGPKLDHRYLKYVLLGERKSFLRFASGTTHQTIYFPEVKAFHVALPPVPVQRKIANVLSALDDRIDNLNAKMETLEEMLQRLFKSWFIDFDPVRFKGISNQQLVLDTDVGNCFPDRFEHSSSLGQVPNGWSVETIGDAVECVGGTTPSTKDDSYWSPATHAWATPKDLSGMRFPVLLSTDRCVSPAGLKKVSSGLLPIGSLLMSSRAPIGYLTIAQTPVAINQGFIAMPPGGKLSPLYMYLWCKANMDVIKQKANGSTFMEISKSAFRPIPILVPPKPVSALFDRVAGRLFAQLVECERYRLELARTRDTLLPRLLKGEIPIASVA